MSTDKVVFAADDDHSGQDYTRVASSAIATLLLGLASTACLLHPVFLIVPALAMVFSWRALAAIARESPRLTGRWLTLCGLFLALLMGSGCLGHWMMSRRMIQQQTREFAEQWLRLAMTGRVQDAFVWMIATRDRPPASVPAKDYLVTHEFLQKRLTVAFSKPPIRDMTQRGQGKLEYQKRLSFKGAEFDRFVVHQFRLEFDQGEPRTMEIAVTVNRQVEDDGRIHFLIFEVSNVSDLILR